MNDVRVTANATLLGGKKNDTLKSHDHAQRGAGVSDPGNDFWRVYGGGISNASEPTGATGSAETAPKHTYFCPFISL